MLANRLSPVSTQIKRFARPVVHSMRVAGVHSQRLRQQGRGPMAVFLPSLGPEGAALLRIYRVAYGLRDLGWRTVILPPRLTLIQRQRLLSRIAPDIVVMQGARHALNRPALYPGRCVVFDMDDADFHLVRDMMRSLAARRPGVTWRLYDRQPGDDPGFAESFACAGLTIEWRKKAKYSDYLRSFDNVAIGLAPLAWETPFSRGKSFGKVLAYLDRFVPVVASNSGEFPDFFDQSNGILATDPTDWETALEQLLTTPALRHAMALRAHAAFVERLSLSAVAQQTDKILRRYIKAQAIV